MAVHYAIKITLSSNLGGRWNNEAARVVSPLNIEQNGMGIKNEKIRTFWDGIFEAAARGQDPVGLLCPFSGAQAWFDE